MSSGFKKLHFNHLKCSAAWNWPVSLQMWPNLQRDRDQTGAAGERPIIDFKRKAHNQKKKKLHNCSCLHENWLKCNVNTDLYPPLQRLDLVLLPVCAYWRCCEPIRPVGGSQLSRSECLTGWLWPLTSSLLSRPSSCKKHVWRDEGVGGERGEVLHRVVE